MGDRVCNPTLLPPQPLLPDPLRYEHAPYTTGENSVLPVDRLITQTEPEETLPSLVTVTRKVPNTKPQACGSMLWG